MYIRLVSLIFLVALAVLANLPLLVCLNPDSKAATEQFEIIGAEPTRNQPAANRFKIVGTIPVNSWDVNYRRTHTIYIVEDGKTGIEYAVWHGDNHIVKLEDGEIRR